MNNITVRFVFRGRIDSETFERFARARAARLSLALEVESADAEAFACVVEGPPALADAFEMACSLGPLNCIVLEVQGGMEAEGANG